MLFSVLSALYIASIFHIFKKRINNFLVSIPVSFLSFVDDCLLILQEKNTSKFNTNLFCSYNIITTIFNNFSPEIKHNKSEVFHFSRATKHHNPQPLNLSLLGGSILTPKEL